MRKLKAAQRCGIKLDVANDCSGFCFFCSSQADLSACELVNCLLLRDRVHSNYDDQPCESSL